MTLTRVGDFHPRDPDKLDRELTQLEDNAFRETQSIRADCAPRALVDRTLVAKPALTSLPAQFDRQISIDTSRGNRTVILPPLSAENFGKTLAIIWRSPAINSAFIACQKPSDKINQSASPATVSAVVTVVYCDDAGYWLK